jgi:hypothetical protein
MNVAWPYREYKSPLTRPHCDLCGPFRGSFLRRMPSGEYRCRGCDEENEN